MVLAEGRSVKAGTCAFNRKVITRLLPRSYHQRHRARGTTMQVIPSSSTGIVRSAKLNGPRREVIVNGPRRKTLGKQAVQCRPDGGGADWIIEANHFPRKTMVVVVAGAPRGNQAITRRRSKTQGTRGRGNPRPRLKSPDAATCTRSFPRYLRTT